MLGLILPARINNSTDCYCCLFVCRTDERVKFVTHIRCFIFLNKTALFSTQIFTLQLVTAKYISAYFAQPF